MKEVVVSENELDVCSARIEKQLSNLENSVNENCERLRVVESYVSSVLQKVRTKLPLTQAVDWEDSLLNIVEMLGDVENVIEKMEEITLRKVTL